MGELDKEKRIVTGIKQRFKEIEAFFNPFGQYFLKYLLIKYLLLTTFLDDIFEIEPELQCETDNIGCELSCRNRYAPISHIQLWYFEFFFVLLSLTMFVGINVLNRQAHLNFEKKKKQNESLRIKTEEQIPSATLSYWNKKTINGTTITKSKYTLIGYIKMLTFRLICQITCLYLDIELCIHSSQKAGGVPVIFNIPEHWVCSTYNYEDPKYHDAIPPENRSKIFYRTDRVMACQQPRDVMCWQPEAYLRPSADLFTTFPYIWNWF